MTSDPEASMNEPDPIAAAPRRRRLQFSLATLMWLTTLAACLAAVWGMYLLLEAGRAEVRLARAELQAARDAGFALVESPSLSRSRAALLEKAGA